MAIGDKAAHEEMLSAREVQIVRLIARGQTNREIAERLVLSEETIKWYNKRAYLKLGVSNRVQAAREARRRGLLDDAGATKESWPSSMRHALPEELSSFVGRTAELEEVRQLLQRSRLVTLTGPGGTGKTRLALRLARHLAQETRRRVVYISLAPVGEAALVAGALIEGLGLSAGAEGDGRRAIRRYLRGKELLLVLDNFEHLLAAAPLVSEMLSAAPGLTVLATSREALRLSGEQVYEVPPLTVPLMSLMGSPAELATYESVSLFVQRAQAVSSGFCLTAENAAIVGAICIRVEGLPLAIELAAARIRLFSPQQLLQQLEQFFDVLRHGARDLPARQRTLWDTIDWSYNLLDDDEQRLFARLAVFNSGFSLEAAENVCGYDLAGMAVDLLDSLTSKSLLYRIDGPGGETRLAMLATVHAFAAEKLAGSGESEPLHGRHLVYFLEKSEEMEPRFRYRGQLQLLSQVEADFANYRAAYLWAMKQGEIEMAGRLLAGIDYYLLYSQETGEGYQWMVQLIGRREEIDARWRGRVLLAASRLAGKVGDLAAEQAFCREGLALARQQKDRRLEAWLLIQMAAPPESKEEESAPALAMIEEALNLARELHDGAALAFAFNALGEIWRMAGDDERARQAYEQSLNACRETGEQYREALMLANLSFVAYNRGAFEQARQLGEEHLRQMATIRMKKPCDILGLAVLAGALGRLGEEERAARLLGAAKALKDEIGAVFQGQDQTQIEKYVRDVRERLGEGKFDAAWLEGERMSLERAIAYATGEEAAAG